MVALLSVGLYAVFHPFIDRFVAEETGPVRWCCHFFTGVILALRAYETLPQLSPGWLVAPALVYIVVSAKTPTLTFPEPPATPSDQRLLLAATFGLTVFTIVKLLLQFVQALPASASLALTGLVWLGVHARVARSVLSEYGTRSLEAINFLFLWGGTRSLLIFQDQAISSLTFLALSLIALTVLSLERVFRPKT